MPQLDIKTLNDVCELIIDCEHKTAPVVSEGYPSIRTPNIGKGRLLLDGVNRVSEETYEKWTQRTKPRSGDLILAREAPVGNVAMIPNNLKVCLGQRTVLIRPDKTKIFGLYLLYLLLGDEIQARFHSQTAGATVAHLNVADIKNLKLPQLPGRDTQLKISTILSAYDDLIENNLRRIKILEEMVQNLYREWFVKFRFPGHQHTRFTDSAIGKIPEGWEVRGAMENKHWSFIHQSIGPYEGVKRYYATADIDGIAITGDGIEYTYSKKPSRAQKQPLLNSVWFARMQETYKVLAVTKPNATLTTNSMLSSGFAGFEASDGDSFAFLFLTIKSNEFHSEKDRYCTGATQRSLTNDGLSRILTVSPSRDVVQHFGRVAMGFVEMILALQQRNLNLRRTRDLLLPKLISGEVDVSELDIAIPEEAQA